MGSTGADSAVSSPCSPWVSAIVRVHEKKGSAATEPLLVLTPPDGFEPSTDCLEGSCSIQLS